MVAVRVCEFCVIASVATRACPNAWRGCIMRVSICTAACVMVQRTAAALRLYKHLCASSLTGIATLAGALGVDHGRGHSVHSADLQPHEPVPAQGVDHGEVGGGLLHHRNGGQQLRLESGGHEQGHCVHAAVVQGARCAWLHHFATCTSGSTGVVAFIQRIQDGALRALRTCTALQESILQRLRMSIECSECLA